MALCFCVFCEQEFRYKTIQAWSEIGVLSVFAVNTVIPFTLLIIVACNLLDNDLLISVSIFCLFQHDFILKNASFVFETVLPIVKKKLKVGVRKVAL